MAANSSGAQIHGSAPRDYPERCEGDLYKIVSLCLLHLSLPYSHIVSVAWDLPTKVRLPSTEKKNSEGWKDRLKRKERLREGKSERSHTPDPNIQDTSWMAAPSHTYTHTQTAPVLTVSQWSIDVITETQGQPGFTADGSVAGSCL